MATVADFCRFLSQFAPQELAESWDNTGLLIGREGSVVHRALTCLTLNHEVAQEAAESGAQLIVTHHPLMFRGTKTITDRTVEGRTLLTLIESGIAVYSPHTSFDSASEGINQQLAESFGLLNIVPLKPLQTNPAAGSGRVGELPSSTELNRFLKIVKEVISADRIEYSGRPDGIVRKVAVGCGAAEGFLSDAVRLGCDTFVTGEARFHTALEAQAQGVTLVLTGHYFSERPAVEHLALILAGEFPGVQISASQNERNPLRGF